MQDISENQTFSGYSQLFGSPSGQFGVLFQQRRQYGFVKWDVLCAFEKPPSAFRIQHSCKNPLKNRNVSIFLIENTLDCNVFNKNEKSWKSVFTLPSAHQKLVFSGLFQDLVIAVRPKWWFLIFWKKWNHTAWDSPKHRFSQKFTNVHFFQLFWSVL